ncbi:hypothetical protein HY489_02810 [Candidatus Woesearchaeota archaeon]|nr:hypothetical protein [Candidatus Woesearchaeota archaeon]
MQGMTKDDWVLVVIILILLVVIALITMNLDTFFPTPTAQQAVIQAMNKT